MKIIGYNIRRIIILNDSGFIFVIEVFYRALHSYNYRSCYFLLFRLKISKEIIPIAIIIMIILKIAAFPKLRA